MARNGWYRTRIFLSSIFLATLCAYAQTERNCARGLKTPGYTEPHGDILIEYGNPLDITCVLNDNYMRDHGENSSKNLYFMLDGQPIPSEMIEVLNSSSIRLHIEKPPKSSAMYICKLKNETNAVCLNNVVVGTKPLPVDDFKCISYNYENLTCTWTQPENYIKTYYNLTYFFPGRAARRYLPYSCPKIITEENQKLSCVWTVLSDPQYRQAQRTFYFQLNMSNIFGTNVLNKTFSHFQHVLSGPPENLTYVNKTSESIYLYWSVPNPMQAFPPGLQHRVMYQSEYGEKNWQFGGIIGLTNPVYFNLTGLKYAHALYDIRIAMRSNAAEPDDESMWSKNSSITVRTMSKIPGAPPKTNIGSFEIVSSGGNSLNNTDVYVYWQQIPEDIKNGQDFSYRIGHVQGGETRYIKPDEMTNAYAKFNNLSVAESHTFRIWSQNSAGQSERESTVYVPKQAERVGEPISFIKIEFGNGKYQLSWEPPKPRTFYNANVTSYTIFWCTHDRERPHQCSGYLSWDQIPNNTTVYNITFPEDKIYHQFAISANSELTSSGMVWATCTVLHNKAIGKMENVWIVRVEATYIEVGWKLDCSDRIGSVKGFIVYYCSIVKPTLTNCKGAEQNMTIDGDSTISRANITGLVPYETYMLAVGVITKHTTQTQKSSLLYATTLEEAPNAPIDVQIVNVTNSSISIIWQKPNVTNGKVKKYTIRYKNATSVYEDDANFEEYTISNLMSYGKYNISVMACTVKCSKPTQVHLVTTLVGYPSKITQPGVTFQNDSFIMVEWEPPVHPRGKNNIYEVSFKGKLEYKNRTVAITNVTDPVYEIKDCGANGKYNTFYISVRAVNIVDDIRYEGPWSDELESFCRTVPNLWLWTLIPVCFFIVLALFYMAKRMYFHFQEMRDVEVKLPSGLAPVVAADIGLNHWGPPKVQEDQSRRPSADEELLLVKMSDSRNLSGDSSGCSSGHESVTSSLESGTHLSSTSDSGTEQPRSSSTEDLRKNSLRLRNVASSRPLSKGYITMPTDNINATTWNPKSAVPGSYCVLGVDPTPITSINPSYVPVTQAELTKLPYILPDASTQPSPYVVTGDVNKPSNSGYVPLNSAEAIEKNPGYVMAGNKGMAVPDLMRLDSVKSTDVEDDKPVYVQVAEPTSNVRKVIPDAFPRHQPCIDASPKIGYVSIGDAPGPRACADPTKGYIPHRHFDAKTLKED